jgi:hypothetical protein
MNVTRAVAPPTRCEVNFSDGTPGFEELNVEIEQSGDADNLSDGGVVDVGGGDLCNKGHLLCSQQNVNVHGNLDVVKGRDSQCQCAEKGGGGDDEEREFSLFVARARTTAIKILVILVSAVRTPDTLVTINSGTHRRQSLPFAGTLIDGAKCVCTCCGDGAGARLGDETLRWRRVLIRRPIARYGVDAVATW